MLILSCVFTVFCRSIDFQCFSKKDYNTLYINLKEIVHKLRNPTVLPPSAAPVLNEFKETLSTKKSVRFNFAEDSSSPAASPGTLGSLVLRMGMCSVVQLQNAW